MKFFLRNKFFLFCTIIFFAGAVNLFAEDSDDSLFSDDDLFGDDNVVELEETNAGFGSEKLDLAKGHLFETGSVKIGGSYDMGLTTYTKFYDGSLEEQKSFADTLAETALAPKANAWLYVDARPSQTFRLYTKFGIDYPYSISAVSIPGYTDYTTPIPGVTFPIVSSITTALTSSFKIKELFTDFSLADRAFFRFGLHTVTWGTGLFFSPVSDMINTSSINPEDTDKQVDGALNLRTQITFPGSQNCLWFYVIPDSVKNTVSADSYSTTSTSRYLELMQYPYDARKTAFAAKGELVLGTWELGAGAYYKWQDAPKAMLTASGAVIASRVNVFAEGVYRYGSAKEWKEKPDDWDEKTHIFQATAGARYTDKTHLITYALQYYYDGNSDDSQYSTKGHNLAALVNFGRIGSTSLTANILGLFNFGKDALPATLTEAQTVLSSGKVPNPYTALVSADLTYSPIKELSLSCGPYISWSDWENKPDVALKLNFSLGSGRF